MRPTTPEKLYDPLYIKQLFNEMSATYGVVNLVSSFGFAWLWRRQCVRLAALKPAARVGDFMSGQGEAWPQVLAAIGSGGQVFAFDISSRMVELSLQTKAYTRHGNVHPSNQNALVSSLAASSLDTVISTFGLKTFSEAQLHTLAAEIARVLRPGGTFALVEISVPASLLLQLPYMFYLEHCIPLIGRLCLAILKTTACLPNTRACSRIRGAPRPSFVLRVLRHPTQSSSSDVPAPSMAPKA